MKKIRTGSIYVRLFRSYFATSLIPVLCLALLTVLFTRQFAMGNVKQKLTPELQGAAGVIQRELESYEESMRLFASYQGVGEFFSYETPDEDELIQINQKMYLITAGKMDSMYLHLVAPDGHILHSTTSQSGIPDNEYSYWGILRALQNAQGPVLYSGVYGSSEPGLTMALPVYERDKVAGYAMLCITDRAFEEMLSGYMTEYQLAYMLVDANHYLVMDDITGTEAVFLPLEFRSLVKAGLTAEYESGGDQKLLAAQPVGDTGLLVAAALSVGLVVSNSRSLTVFVVIVCLAALVVTLLTSRRLARSVVQPIRVICDTMQVIENGDMNARVPELGNDELGTMGRSFNLMVSQLQEQFYTNLERQDRLRIAEFKNLQAQISPHFLYNTLESIKFLARLGMNEEIDIVVSKLGIMLRSGMNFKQDMIPLRDELKVVESYIAIQQVRYEGKFTYTAHISPELLDCMVPNLVVQPLVENAIVHGIEAKVGKGELKLTGWLEGNDIYIEIYDNGGGIDQERLTRVFRDEGGPQNPVSERESIGMVNVHRRLKLYFGEPYGLTVESEPGEFTRVRLHIPKAEGSEYHVHSGDR